MWWGKVFTCGSNINRNNILLSNKYLGRIKNRHGIIISQHHSRNYSEVGNTNDSEDGLSRFEKLLRDRRRQAKKAVLIHVFNELVIGKLINQCQKYGNISRLSHYKLFNDKEFVLMEFEREIDAEQLISNATHFKNQNIIPVHSKCLWYGDQVHDVGTPMDLMYHAEVPKDQITENLRQADSVSDQMIKLHENSKLPEVGQLLRFFVCHQLEMALSGLFSNCTILPFGSTVNGFGKFHCDLDMVLSLKDEISANSANENDDGKWLYFHTKRIITSNRSQSQRNLEFMAGLIGGFLPGCSNVQRIIHARVPIIKFRHDLVNTECDLSMSNLSGVYMSELLYLLGEFDNRLNLLGFSVLYWAKGVGLTQDHPGTFITNFSLILMTVFFLQTRPKPLLPSLGQLQTMAGKSDVRLTDDIDCTFLRDISKFPKMENQESIEELLIEFFKFYSNFDYRKDGISIVHGKKVTKSDSTALYIENPLETHLNVSRNVTRDELEHICQRMQTSLWNLEGYRSKPKTKSKWGLLSLFNVSEKKVKVMPLLQRIPVEELFEKGETESEVVPPNFEERKSRENSTNGSKSSKTQVEEKGDLVNKLNITVVSKSGTINRNQTNKLRNLKKPRVRMNPGPWTF